MKKIVARKRVFANKPLTSIKKKNPGIGVQVEDRQIPKSSKRTKSHL